MLLHWTNQCLVNNSARNNETGTIICSKSANTPLMQRRRNRWHLCHHGVLTPRCYWHETVPPWNQYLVSKQGRKQITGAMICSKSAQPMRWDYANKITPMAHVLLTWTNLYLVSKQCKKQNNWNNDVFKVHSKCIGIMQRRWHRWCMLMALEKSLHNGNILKD